MSDKEKRVGKEAYPNGSIVDPMAFNHKHFASDNKANYSTPVGYSLMILF